MRRFVLLIIFIDLTLCFFKEIRPLQLNDNRPPRLDGHQLVEDSSFNLSEIPQLASHGRPANPEMTLGRELGLDFGRKFELNQAESVPFLV